MELELPRESTGSDQLSCTCLFLVSPVFIFGSVSGEFRAVEIAISACRLDSKKERFAGPVKIQNAEERKMLGSAALSVFLQACMPSESAFA